MSDSPITGSSYQQRAIDVTITLGQGTFGQTGKNTVKLSGLRVAATIAKAGFPSFDSTEVRVYGVVPSIMNQISTLGVVPIVMERQHNTILVEAGTVGGNMTAVYQGNLMSSYQNLDGMPDTFLELIGYGGMSAAMQPVSPLSVSGTADVATLMAGLANRMGLAFENNGVQVQISNPYLPGTLLDQAHSLARAANIQMYIDGGTVAPSATVGFGTLAIWPYNMSRRGTVPIISAATGLVGYPKFQGFGMAFRCLFNPNLRVGGQIEMRSTVGNPAPTASNLATTNQGGPNGTWTIKGPLTYDLSAQMPGGSWFCDVACVRSGGGNLGAAP